jgi:protein required for attachment to host cells
MGTNWIVTANAGRARIFCQQGIAGEPREVADLIDDAVRLRTSDTETDRLGPTAAAGSHHNTGGTVPNKTWEPQQTPVEHEMERSARHVASYLLTARRKGEFEQLIVFASPDFLGLLRQFFDPVVKDCIEFEVARDYTQADARQMNEYVQQHRAGTA